MNVYFNVYFKTTISMFGYSDPNTGIDQSHARLVLYMLFYNIFSSFDITFEVKFLQLLASFSIKQRIQLNRLSTTTISY